MSARQGQVHTVPWTRSRLVRVVATMQQGAVLDERWPITLDGILAGEARRLRLGFGYGSVIDHHQEGLPLANWTKGCAKQWWWAASGAWPLGSSERDVHWIHKRVKHLAAEQTTGDNLPPIIRDSMSRYRAYRLPMVSTACAALEWWCVGDPDAIRDLCASVAAVGKKCASGEGAVVRWTVTDEGVPDLDPVLWRPDGIISRPVPARCAAALGLGTVETVQATIRPPYWRPAQLEQSDGGFRRAWRDVIAPWTERPADWGAHTLAWWPFETAPAA